MDEKKKGICDRCNLPHGGTTTMSMFNTDTICIPCKEEENSHEDYTKACDAELIECGNGNYSFSGIGLPADLVAKYKTT